MIGRSGHLLVESNMQSTIGTLTKYLSQGATDSVISDCKGMNSTKDKKERKLRLVEPQTDTCTPRALVPEATIVNRT